MPFSGSLARKSKLFNVIPREPKSKQYHLLTMIARELSKENVNAKQRVGKNQLLVHVEKSMYYNGRKI
jgi:hypothetical protein